jgi:hypothetical protein
LALASPDTTDVPSPSVSNFLKSEAAKLHCCTTDKFLDAAALYERAAEDLPREAPEVVENLRLAAYFLYYGGKLDRARATMVRAGDFARKQGSTRVAAQAYVEAAHIAHHNEDDYSARKLLLRSQELEQEASEP